MFDIFSMLEKEREWTRIFFFLASWSRRFENSVKTFWCLFARAYLAIPTIPAPPSSHSTTHSCCARSSFHRNACVRACVCSRVSKRGWEQWGGTLLASFSLHNTGVDVRSFFSPFQSIKENTFDSTGLELWKASPSRLSFLLSIWRKEELRTKVKLIASISRLVCEEKKGEDTLKTNDGLQRISQRHPASTYEKFRKLMGENRHEGALHFRPC